MVEMDSWAKMESNLNNLLGAGLVELGQIPHVDSWGGGPSREEIAAETVRAERIRAWSKSWRRQK